MTDSSLQSLQNKMIDRSSEPATVFSLLLPIMKKPIMSKSVESDILDALAQYQNRDKWKRWGMNEIREQGSAILLHGPSGTGKTTIAKWMSEQLRRGFKQLDVSKIGGGDPGQSEANVHAFFEDAKKRNNAFILLDECDHLLGDRNNIGEAGQTWMIGTTEAIMVNMNVYAGPVVCATNNVDKLDPAMANRFMSIVHVGEPDMDMRARLWKIKWPKKFPLQPSPREIERLARHEINGRQIETVFVNVASHALRKGMRPTFQMFDTFCLREKGKHIEKNQN